MDETKPARRSRVLAGSVGGNLALDFTNTANWVENETVDDRLKLYPDLIEWAHGRAIIDDAVERELRVAGNEEPQLADAAIQSAQAVRHEMHRVFSSLASDKDPFPTSFQAFNDILADLRLRVARTDDVFFFDWKIGPDEPASVLRPIVWEATKLLTSEDLARVKMCPGDRCGWLFVDSSRRRNRRWCDMRDCGNRAKARRHYQRHRLGESEKR